MDDTMIEEIILHCSATRPEWLSGLPLSAKISEINRWHRERGWAGIGYHWVIDRDGTIAQGRQESQQGAHTSGHNVGTIGVCLLGGFGSNATDRFGDHYTPEQEAALTRLIEQIRSRHTITRISGHNDYSPRACPGFRVGEWLAHRPRRLVETRTVIGQAAAATGTLGATAVDSIAPLMSDAAQHVGQVSHLSHGLTVLFVALTLAGIALTVYARWDDWRRGRR